MKFQTPQFIETETKLVGPLTLKQFLWVAAGVAISYLLFLFLSLTVWFFITAGPILAGAVALAFLKIDDLPFPNYLINMVLFLLTPRRYLFKKNSDKINLP
jgi:hypothetical protein